ncbi:MAG: transglycosylase SLT domain-containing protein [Neomegalonema sp.]|nr:transglycosylase SLT domain-containing protein [Neomegalonema sp.]
MKRLLHSLRPVFAIALVAGLAACAGSTPPRQANDACAIFEEKPRWLTAARDAERRWSASPAVMMAIIYRESSFRHDAKPPKDTVMFGLIPWGRVSSAYGYAQALDGTWAWYQRETGNSWADRDDFDDAIDFVGWYMAKTRRLNGVSMLNGEHQYLAYHEGHTGYQRRTYQSKAWLRRAAREVGQLADRYAAQMRRCGLM